MGETDIAFRHLLRELPDPLLQLAFPRRRLRFLGPLDASTDRPRQLTTDTLFRVREGREECIVHVEVERGWRKDIERRVYDYSTAAHTRTGLPVVSVVLLLRRGGKPPASPATYRLRALGHDTHVLRYHVLPLWQLDARKMRERLPPDGWAFCVAMRGSSRAFVRELARDLAAREDLPAQRRDRGLGLLFIITAAMLGEATAEGIFKMDSIMQSPGVQALIRKWEDKGREEGKIQGLRTACLTLIKAKAGAELGRLDAAHSAETLERLLVDLVSAQDEEAVRAALARVE